MTEINSFSAKKLARYDEQTKHITRPFDGVKFNEHKNYKAKQLIETGIMCLFDGEKGAPLLAEKSLDRMIDKNEFSRITKAEYEDYVFKMRRYLKFHGKDLTGVNIPSYDEMKNMMKKGQINFSELKNVVEQKPALEKKLNVDPDFPEKYSDEDILKIIRKNKTKKSRMSDVAILDTITNACAKHNLDRKIFTQLICQESRFNPNARSYAGAVGLAQLMPATARGLGLKSNEYYDPQKNAEAGAKYLKQLLVKYKGDVKKALAAYNAGMGNVAKYNGIPPFKETRNYVNTITTGFLSAEA